jgi:hypothetical protein
VNEEVLYFTIFVCSDFGRMLDKRMQRGLRMLIQIIDFIKR